jgi:hypothetical protein
VKSLGVNGVIDNVSLSPGTLQWYSNTLNMSMYARAAWNPAVDVDAEVADHVRHLYGAAAPPMQRFWQLMKHCTTRYGLEPAYTPTDAALRKPEAVHGWMTDVRSLIPNRAAFDKAMVILGEAAARVAPSARRTPVPNDRAIAFRIQALRDVIERWQPPVRDYRVFGFLNGGGAGVNHVYAGSSVAGTVSCSLTGGNNHADCFWPAPPGAQQLAKPGDAVQVDACVNYGPDVVGETVYRSGPGLYQAADQAAACAAPGTRSVALFIGNMDDDRSDPRRVILTVHDGGYATTVRSSADNVWDYGRPISLRIDYTGPRDGGEAYRYLYRAGDRWIELATITLGGKLPYAAPMHYWAGLDYGRKAHFPLIDWARVSGFTATRRR